MFVHVYYLCVLDLLRVPIKEKLQKNDPTSWVLLNDHSETYIDSKNTTGYHCHWIDFVFAPSRAGRKCLGSLFEGAFKRWDFTWWVLHAGVWWHCLVPKKICSQQVGCTTLWDPQHDHWKLLTSCSVENSWKKIMSKWWKTKHDDVQRQSPLQIFHLPGPLEMRWPTIFDHPRNPPGVPNAPMPFTCG